MRPVNLVEGTQTIKYPVAQATLTRRFTERAISFIERKRAQPFFLYVAQVMPHKPLATTEQYYQHSGAGLYGDVLMDLQADPGEQHDLAAQLPDEVARLKKLYDDMLGEVPNSSSGEQR